MLTHLRSDLKLEKYVLTPSWSQGNKSLFFLIRMNWERNKTFLKVTKQPTIKASLKKQPDINTKSFSQQLIISLLSFPVPESPPGTSKANRSVWIILLLAITGVLIILIMITLTEMMRRSRKRCQKDDIRKIRYKKQIDFTGSNEYFTPITKLKTVLSSQSI